MITTDQGEREHIITDLMPDLTPLLDVMFMLIVFFILTANAVPYTLDLNLPEDKEAISQALDEHDTISVSLLPATQGWKIDETPFSEEEKFKAALIKAYQAHKDKKVVIMGDQDVSMQKLMDLLAFLRKQNIQTADILMERK